MSKEKPTGIYIKHVCDLEVNIKFFARVLLYLKYLRHVNPTETETEEKERDIERI